MQAMMNERQRVALEHHCRLAAETVQPRFTWRGGMHSVVLTVNSGYE
jgi:hypothetical protein